jgi:hypothetical protein
MVRPRKLVTTWDRAYRREQAELHRPMGSLMGAGNKGNCCQSHHCNTPHTHASACHPALALCQALAGKKTPCAPEGHGRAADVRAGAAAEREQEVDDGHDRRQHQRGRRNDANDPQVIGDVLQARSVVLGSWHYCRPFLPCSFGNLHDGLVCRRRRHARKSTEHSMPGPIALMPHRWHTGPAPGS